MQNTANNDFYDLWLSKRQEGAENGDLPLLSAFSRGELDGFGGQDVLMILDDNEIVYAHCGKRITEVVGKDLVGQSIFFAHPEEMVEPQRDLTMLGFIKKIGIQRLSRFWYGHRHKDIEFLLLPVEDDDRGGTAMIGLIVSSSYNEHDILAEGHSSIERIISQKYLSLGKDVLLKNVSGSTWSFLHAMGTIVTIDDEIFEPAHTSIIGELGKKASSAGRPNVLAVCSVKELSKLLARFGARYKLKLVQSGEEAKTIIEIDSVDVLIASEILPDGNSGLELLKSVKSHCPSAGLVLMLENRKGAEDQVLQTDSGPVHCLVKPVGEFAMRQAVDDAILLMKSRNVERARYS